MLYEVIDPLEVIKSELLNIVVACTVNVVGSILVLALLVHLLRMVKWHYLVSSAMDDVNGAVYVFYSIDVRKLVEWQRPSQVKEHSERGHETTIDNDPGNGIFLCQVAGGT